MAEPMAADKGEGSGSEGRHRRTGIRESLLDRYRVILVNKLTIKDLSELQDYLRKEFDEGGNLNREVREKFEFKLRQFLDEEVLTREIVGIEALIRSLRPGDLKR